MKAIESAFYIITCVFFTYITYTIFNMHEFMGTAIIAAITILVYAHTLSTIKEYFKS